MGSSIRGMKMSSVEIYARIRLSLIAATISLLLVCGRGLKVADSSEQQPTRPLQRVSPRIRPSTGVLTGTAVEIAPPINVPALTNRTTRTADVFQNGDGYNIFVTNTCERESMKVNIKTSRPFYGVIHTKTHRQKPICSIDGNGDIDYNLEISDVLNPQDPAYCGVIQVRKASPEDRDTLTVVVAVRVHRNIELSDDKFFLLNCTNRCRLPDCSNPNAKLTASDDNETVTTDANERSGVEREANNGRTGDKKLDECTIWKFPWAIALFWCLGILLLCMIISHIIMCSSVVCRCNTTEEEEKEPSEHEIPINYEDRYNKRHPYRIDYDNRDIYTNASKSYTPYNINETQSKSRRKHKHDPR